MQSEADRKRIESIGADPKRVKVFGNLKFDARPAGKSLDSNFAAWLRSWNPLWIAASTMPGEDEMVLDAFRVLRQSWHELKLMIAPRHPERAGNVIDLAGKRGLKSIRRTRLETDADVIVLDTIGELASTFEFASVVFVGGSLVERGGHNILEPASCSKPVLFGPHMENFRDIARLFLEAKAAMQIADPSALAPTVEQVLRNPAVAHSLARNAHQVVLQNTGATDRVLEFIREQILIPTAAAAYDR
jgi:3-deoxy-D-manno-octulosonic-acid transferase